MNMTSDSAKWQFTSDSERREAIEAEADAQVRIAEAEASKGMIDLNSLAWAIFGCCCVICYTIYFMHVPQVPQ
jgi:hypothetical protein